MNELLNFSFIVDGERGYDGNKIQLLRSAPTEQGSSGSFGNIDSLVWCHAMFGFDGYVKFSKNFEWFLWFIWVNSGGCGL